EGVFCFRATESEVCPSGTDTLVTQRHAIHYKKRRTPTPDRTHPTDKYVDACTRFATGLCDTYTRYLPLEQVVYRNTYPLFQALSFELGQRASHVGSCLASVT